MKPSGDSRAVHSPALVALAPCPTYEADTLDAGLATVVERLGGWGAILPAEGPILIKPNLVAPRPAESAATTHPAFVVAVVRALRRVYRGAIRVGDSPVVGSATRVLRRLDLEGPLQDLGVEILDFDDTVRVDGGGAFGPFDLARPVVEAGAVINLPKLKTHAQMALTLGVKNLFGTLVGLAKSRWHLQAGRDPRVFARLLLEVERRVHPALTLLDGVVAMEGNGPTAGTPRPLGLIAGARSAPVLDAAIADLLGYTLAEVPVLAAALAEGRIPDDVPALVRQADPAGRFQVERWQRAASTPCDATVIPSPIARALRHQLTTRPRFLARRCKRCGLCVQHCAAGALSLDAAAPRPGHSAGLRLNLDACIRCYCCQEVCPEGAVMVEDGALLRLARWLRRRAGR